MIGAEDILNTTSGLLIRFKVIIGWNLMNLSHQIISSFTSHLYFFLFVGQFFFGLGQAQMRLVLDNLSSFPPPEVAHRPRPAMPWDSMQLGDPNLSQSLSALAIDGVVPKKWKNANINQNDKDQ